MKSSIRSGPLIARILLVGEMLVRVVSKKNASPISKEVWTDMRPLSLRKKMEEAERQKKQG
jgi:hypothetical protein